MSDTPTSPPFDEPTIDGPTIDEPAIDDPTGVDPVAALEALPRRPDPWRWPRRVLMAAALAAAIAFVVVTLQRSPESASRPGAVSDPAVVRQVPAPGSHVLRQTSVGVELLPGYDGRLTIDGVAIPEDQLDGAIGPDNPMYDPKLGIRPNNRNHVFFTPGPGKAVASYHTGEVVISARFWNIADGEATARTVTWAYFVN